MHYRRPRHRLLSERGSAPVEFVLVVVLLLALFTGVLQLGLLLHMRNVVVTSATEAARAAADADLDCAAGSARASALISGSLSRRIAAGLSVRRCTQLDGPVPVVEVELEVRLPLTFFPGGSVRVHALGHAVREGVGDATAPAR